MRDICYKINIIIFLLFSFIKIVMLSKIRINKFLIQNWAFLIIMNYEKKNKIGDNANL